MRYPEMNWRPVVLCVGVCVIVGLWLSSPIVVTLLFDKWETRGQFGDAFGFVNALFSGLALAGVVYTILLQHAELRQNTKELKRAASAQEKSERALKVQSEILRKTLVYQSFAALTSEYREARMLAAVRSLWEWYRGLGDEDLASAYLERMDRDRQALEAAPEETRVAVEASTLHYQRRKVSQFYSQVAVFIAEGIIPEEMFYGSWGETDLEIIPKILLPVENTLRQATVGPGLPERDETSPLMRLYRGSLKRNRSAPPAPKKL